MNKIERQILKNQIQIMKRLLGKESWLEDNLKESVDLLFPKPTEESACDRSEEDCYVGIKKCGCLVAIVSKDISEGDLKETLAEYKDSGYKVQEMNIEEARKKLSFCKCVKRGRE